MFSKCASATNVTVIGLNRGSILHLKRPLLTQVVRAQIECSLKDLPDDVLGMPGLKFAVELQGQAAVVGIFRDDRLLVNCGFCWGPKLSSDLWRYCAAVRFAFCGPRKIEPLDEPKAYPWIAEMVRSKEVEFDPDEARVLLCFLLALLSVLEEKYPRGYDLMVAP